MNLYMDDEWNGYKGELISLALCAENGQEFYECLECQKPIDWVRDNVIQVLHKEPISLDRLRVRLTQFLSQFDNVHIITDWPEDVAYFCNLIVTGPGERIDTHPLTFEVLRVDTDSEIPHNALSDARALMDHCRWQRTTLEI